MIKLYIDCLTQNVLHLIFSCFYDNREMICINFRVFYSSIPRILMNWFVLLIQKLFSHKITYQITFWIKWYIINVVRPIRLNPSDIKTYFYSKVFEFSIFCFYINMKIELSFVWCWRAIFSISWNERWTNLNYLIKSKYALYSLDVS